MQLFAAHDQPGAGGPLGQVDEIGDLRDMGAFSLLTAAAAGGLPTALRAVRVDVGAVVDPADRRMDAGVRASDHREPDVAGTATCHEPVGAPGRIGAHLHLAAHRRGVVAGAVADGDLGGQLPERGVQHGEMIGDRVRTGVARAEQPGERFAGVGVGPQRPVRL